jgi:hypothetical protein
MRVVLVLLLVAAVACGGRPKAQDGAPVPTYDGKTGKLTLLTADLNKDGKPDTWTYMNGTIPVRTEQDSNGDGKIDRWEYLDEAGKLVKAENSATGDHSRISRWETYENGILVLVEEDTNGDGRPDKWEKHRGLPILSVEFDTNFDGLPDQRITYSQGGTIESIETQPDGRGGYLKKVKH